MSKGEVTFFSGKMGSGKTTLSKTVAVQKGAVLLCEDEWLESLYPKKITSLADYVELSNQLKVPMKKLVQLILNAGTNVVMDFPANTVPQRDWFRSLFSEIEASHELVYINVTNEVCLKQIEMRRAQLPTQAATDTKEMFEAVTKYFAEPLPEEGFNLKIHSC